MQCAAPPGVRRRWLEAAFPRTQQHESRTLVRCREGAILDGAMRVTVFAPSAPLAPYVRHFTIVETREEATRTLLPDEGLIVGFRYGGAARLIEPAGAVRLPDASLAGVRTTARRMNTSAGGGVVLSVFRAGGAAAIFREPLHELFGAMLELGELVPRRDVERTHESVAEARDDTARVAAVERFLLERLNPARVDPLVARAVSTMQKEHGSIRVSTLARDLELSRDRFEKRFRAAVGAPPKQLASLFRVRHAIRLHEAGADLTSTALDAGYSDQSHFIREFRAVTGEAPRRFFRTVERC